MSGETCGTHDKWPLKCSFCQSNYYGHIFGRLYTIFSIKKVILNNEKTMAWHNIIPLWWCRSCELITFTRLVVGVLSHFHFGFASSSMTMVRHFNEFRGRNVFTCAQSGDAKTVSFTRHLGSVFVQPLCWHSLTGQGRQWQQNSLSRQVDLSVRIFSF